ncbi:NnrS family protein [Maritalea mediterranea]|uniref:NnrS family protein n=1 Tax=Maritalea mediterranea TaxID=2909667 RepID=A0ABS9EAP3_9HYPH|nr:NnrS family protein [Maritalea mediterranea]MCF4099957.1 NnrS family protein [Maritalea mediterranea]
MAIARTNAYSGPTLFSYGFRPFFLFGAFYAGLTILLWVPFYFGELSLPLAMGPADWHMHETLFGFVPAVIAGFLLTAVPNWTGRLPVNGNALIALLLAWALGRLVTNMSALVPLWSVVALNLVFPVLFAAAVCREILAGKNWRNLKVLVMFGLLVLAQGWFYLAWANGGSTRPAAYLALGVVLMLIMLIGGRIVPSFTRNYLVKRQSETLPQPFNGFDKLTVLTSAIVLLGFVLQSTGLFSLPLVFAFGFMILAGLHLVRLLRWHPELIWRDGLLLVLHVGYGFLPIGFAFMGLHFLDEGVVPIAAPIHALSTGAIGLMVIGVMCRATLGHTGHPLLASQGTSVLFAAILLAAILRIVAALSPDLSLLLMRVSHLMWVIGFWGFVALYGGKLMRPRAAPKG